MQQILTALAAEGMILAKDVETPEGRVLCGKGTPLDDKLIRRLEKMDITNITVEGHPVTIEGEKTVEEELNDMEERFSRVKHIQPLMFLKKRLAERLIASRSE
ncbi:MAG: hypothetical protein KAI75_04635 [Desulfobulbaceae bacterium]|nr:hypothetical protein [Desulfobulbaceae bacterium]MCK5404490.1 hypothetical protein [Desulfobulbaceae bacterium]